MVFHKNITKKCYPYWLNCPDKIEKSKCEVYRDCLFSNECFKEWRSKGGPVASDNEMEKW